MGLIILIVLGSLIGWLTVIVLRLKNRQEVVLNIAAGVVGALLVGLATNHGSLLGGISPTALLWSFAGAIVSLVLANLLREGLIH